MSNERPLIVVGIDGSPGSLDALRWAVDQASLTGAVVHAVTAWQLPEVYAYEAIDYEGEARVRLQEAVDKALGPDRGAAVVTRVVAGRPGTVLVDASRDASLLVVGSHRHHEITARLIDSVGVHCLTHADCPVVVVRHHAR